MTIHIETPRLIIRDLRPSDDEGMFELDSDKDVHTYVGNRPIQTIEQARDVIELIRRQYRENGIGRWAVTEKESGRFIGWTGLKLITETTNDHIGFIELGYRFIKKYWGNGYATETVHPCLEYGFETLNQHVIYAMTHAENKASKNVLRKAGMTQKNRFECDGSPHDWFELTKADWLRSIR